jgi:hypothetical protein
MASIVYFVYSSEYSDDPVSLFFKKKKKVENAKF